MPRRGYRPLRRSGLADTVTVTVGERDAHGRRRSRRVLDVVVLGRGRLHRERVGAGGVRHRDRGRPRRRTVLAVVERDTAGDIGVPSSSLVKAPVSVTDVPDVMLVGVAVSVKFVPGSETVTNGLYCPALFSARTSKA